MKKIVCGAVGAALALTAAACSPGSGSDAGGSDKTYKIAYLGILTGPNATKGVTHAFELAIKKVNADGGIDGRKVEFKSFDTDITPEGAARATSLAIRYGPDAVVGYGVSAGLKASIGSLKAAGVPVIHNTLGDLTSAKNLGYDNVFRLGPTSSQYAKAADSYLINEKGVKSAMIIHTEDSTPTAGAEEIQADFKDQGVTTKIRSVSPAVTDLTEPILAAKGMDAIWSWGYATSDALTVKQAAQNGVKVPIMTFSVGSAILNKLIPTSLATDDLLQVSNCGAIVNPSEVAKTFVKDYTAAYGTDPIDGLEPRNYDAVMLLKAAAEKAGSTDGKKVGKALGEVEYDGVCGSLKSDDKNNLYQNVPILDFAGGKPNLAKLEEAVPSDF